jgi:hypothetical protein
MQRLSYIATAITWLILPLGTFGALAQEVVGTADGEQSGVRIDITELKRTSGDTVTMKFTLVNDSGTAASPYNLFNGDDVGEVHLIDAAGKKKYLVIQDSGNNCVCSSNLGHEFPGGQNSMNLWARFPAPPAGVQEVSVVFPHFIPTDAPIAQ